MNPLAKSPRRVYRGRMRKHVIRTVPDIVDAFGSQKNLAAWIGVVPQAVSNWCAAEDIPTAYHYRLHLWATWHGHRLEPSTFRLAPDGKLAKLRHAKAA